MSTEIYCRFTINRIFVVFVEKWKARAEAPNFWEDVEFFEYVLFQRVRTGQLGRREGERGELFWVQAARQLTEGHVTQFLTRAILIK